jgi:uncharacterized membrane protein YphA (DoxX/SURF4 family)
MQTTLWILQILGALLFLASGVMKVFMLEKVSADVASFGALPPRVWNALGVLELLCVLGLVLPAVLHWQPQLVAYAAALLALETLVFVGVHIKYREVPPIIFSALLGLAMAFLAYGRLVTVPLT